MGSYVPTTAAEQVQMLQAIGLPELDSLYDAVPRQMLLKDNALRLADGCSELEVRRDITALSGQNTVFSTVLRGAGAYRHYIPSVVQSVVSREELVTAYTPYQAEASQGLLQAIFEYQTMICQLTGMDVSNASVYDGATAAAEAAAMCRDRRRTRILVSACVHPHTLQTLKTYCFGSGAVLTLIPEKDGRTDPQALEEALGDDAACLLIQQPNFFGQIEDAAALGQQIHSAGGKYIISFNPIACALLQTPAEAGADIAVGEGQPLGLPLSFGGPYLGIMAASAAMMRKLPGRIVGQTTDAQGRRGYVLTLSAREQHIRREKASSNICSNEALCAMTAAVYLAAMGPDGMGRAASLSRDKAHYLASQLESAGLSLLYRGPFFHEFVTACPEAVSRSILSALEAKGILGGLPVAGGLLWCCTELVSRQELDAAAAVVKEVLQRETAV